jgi:hypothetical protein
MKMQQEHESEKQKAMVRLRYMEAYCRTTMPPPALSEPSTGLLTSDVLLPERKVTERDYHNLAQQYRERDTMDNLQASRINVLRGRQKKAVENLIRRREQDLEKLERAQDKELASVDQDHANQEERLRLALGAKRARLEMRWRTQALIERTKAERTTGLKHAALPDVIAIDDSRIPVVAAG